MNPKTGDIVSGAALAGLGVYIVAEARRWEYLGVDGPGPGFFPTWYGLAMIALGLLLVAIRVAPSRAAIAGRGGGNEGPTAARRDGSSTSSRVDWRPIGRAMTTWAGLVAWVALLGILGFVCSFALFTFFVATGMYRRPLLPSLAVAVGGALGFYLLFPVALNVSLPTGWLGF